MKRLLVVLLIAGMIVSLVLAGCAAPAPTPPPKPALTPSPAPAQVIQLRFGHQNPPAARTTVKFIDPYAKKIEEATKGAVKITMYPAESLFKATEAYEATAGGMTDICFTMMSYYAGRFPLTSVMMLPFLVLSSGKIDGKVRSGGAVNSHILQELYETVPEIQAEWKDVKLLQITCSDPTALFTSKKPVRNLDDLKGLKLREQGGYPSEMWKLLGATPVNMGMPDTYDAVSKGVIDGVNTSWGPAATWKLFEVLKYWNDFGTVATPVFTIMNLNKWNSLPPDIQKAITSVGGMSGAEFGGDMVFGVEVRDDYLAAAEKAGKTVEKIAFDPGDYNKCKEIAGVPLWNKWVDEMKAKGLNGQKVLDATLNLLKKYSP
jgi:TRAP-type C4-dicarboxylate transport system substrate-binding protein